MIRKHHVQYGLALFTSLFLLPAALANPVAKAAFNLNSGELCFPMQLSTSGETYDVCLGLESLSPQISFSLNSVLPAAHVLADIAQYSQEEGLNLPLVSLSDGRNFTDVNLAVSVDSATDVYTFTLTQARRLRYDMSKSVARIWNDALLDSIRKDFARPTVHARNLFHTSVAMYDAWAALDAQAEPYLLGKTLNGYSCPYAGLSPGQDQAATVKEAISYAAFRILSARFAQSPGAVVSARRYKDLMLLLGYDRQAATRDLSSGSGAALGNTIADCVLAYGLLDGSNEANAYANTVYKPLNEPMFAARPGNPNLAFPDHWQPLSFNEFRDQSGNIFAGATPAFVSPEWGKVWPFSLQAADSATYSRNGASWKVYHDPGAPPLLSDPQSAAEYRWGFELVAIWSSQLDPKDNVLMDISPAAIGNITEYPTTLAQYHQFYKLGGGDTSQGYELNPATGAPYTPQLVPRADYARVLAEFWADGPDSETPPGHWFTILNYVADHPAFQRRFKGQGAVLDELQWDVKAYFMMGGAMHDAAVTAWGIKGYYDYVRPVSAIRHMAGLGQSSDQSQPSYHPQGIDLVPGYIELVRSGDALAGANGENLGKIKLYAWRGPDLIIDPDTDQSGVGWVLAENWWPYQRPTFVTPPFAGYISGHSTYSRAAAELMTLLTGDAYFPGGMGEFVAKKNEFLVFEEGPSVDVVLQWATYRDASDQTSLSRIWGGIHPPADDMPGRRIGAVIGVEAFTKAEQYFKGTAP